MTLFSEKALILAKQWLGGPFRNLHRPSDIVGPDGRPINSTEPPGKVAKVQPTLDPFTALSEVLEKWFYKPDLQAIRIVLGVAKAHFLQIGDPAWLFVVAPPGTGKTTISIMAAAGLPEVLAIGDLSENTLLSGFHGHKEPGLLEKLGKTREEGKTLVTEGNALVLLKDFTTVLSMRREKRAAILGQLREIHDGEFKRSFGTGVSKVWRGRITMIAAVTPALDRQYSIFSTLGERFLQVRWHRPDSPEAGEWAIRQQGHEMCIRQELREAVRQLFQGSSEVAPTLPEDMQRRLAACAEIVAIARTHVYRDGFGNRDIQSVPEPESNTRIAKGLSAMAKGIAALQGRTEVAEQDLQDVFRVAFDCLTDARRKIVVPALQHGNLLRVDIVSTTQRRALEELQELGILAEDESLLPRFKALVETARLDGVFRPPETYGVGELKEKETPRDGANTSGARIN